MTGSEVPGVGRLRFVTWNVRSLRDDITQVTDVLRTLRPDVVALQEAPRFLLADRRTRRLAARAGLRLVAGGSRAHGTALLTSERVDTAASVVVPLSATPRRHRRAVTAAGIEAAGSVVTVASVHLGLDAGERRRHCGELFDFIEEFATPDRPWVVGLDTNEPPDGPVTAALRAGTASVPGLVDVFATASTLAPTFPAARPQARIDQIWTSAVVPVLRAGVPVLPGLARASDHLPVVADLALSAPPPDPSGWGAAS